MRKLISQRHLAMFAILGAGLVLNACDGLLTENPPHIIVADNLFVDAAGFEAGINALYALARSEHEPIAGTGQVWDSPWVAGTDAVRGSSAFALLFNNWGVEIRSTTPMLQMIWTWLYDMVNTANTIIDRAENPNVRWTQDQKDQTVAQARFFRAYAYRHLTYLWGDVPLNLEESSGESVRTDWERASVTEIRNQIEQDLRFAAEHLPPIPPRPHSVTSAVARHYLAELYLLIGEDARAEEEATSVINSGHYQLITERYGVRANEPGVAFMDQFYDGNINRTQGNTEILWAYQFAKDVPGGGRPIKRRGWLPPYEQIRGMRITVETGGRGIHRHVPTRWALTNYEPQDDRGSHHAIRWFLLMNDPDGLPEGAQLGDTVWLDQTGPDRSDPVANWPWPRKYEWADPLDPIGNFDWHPHPKLRLAETYLLLAEAQFNQSKLAEAAQTLNVLRSRANASPITPAQVTLDFILDERARELLQEEERRYVLLRTGKWLERTRQHNPIAGPNIEDHNVLYPIPQAVIDANLDQPMPQNPGY